VPINVLRFVSSDITVNWPRLTGFGFVLTAQLFPDSLFGCRVGMRDDVTVRVPLLLPALEKQRRKPISSVTVRLFVTD
jgi:hypothetical protein